MKIEQAVERYLKERRANISESTHYNHSSLLGQFIEWCESQGEVKNVEDLDSFHVSDFKIHRRDEDGINSVTLYNQMSVLRVFLRWCESRGLVGGLAENIMMPTRKNEARDTMIDDETAEKILQHLQKFDYASFRHTVFAVLWDTGCRVGTLRAFDLRDYRPDEIHVAVHHRPETGTPLKNQGAAEREINLHPWVCDILDDYIEQKRENVTDEFGREPLVTTKHGRPSRASVRRQINAITRPCFFTSECPHERVIEDCEAAHEAKTARQCPSSVPPHAIRRSSITNWLNGGHSKKLLSDRMDVSVKTLDKHYDARTESEKRELRKEMLDL